jgi:hypothetical protein
MLTWRLHRLHKLTNQESQRRYPQDTGLSMSNGRGVSLSLAPSGRRSWRRITLRRNAIRW